jgi:putative general porin
MDGYMTKLRNLATLLLVALAPAMALADEYQWEVKGAYDRDLPGDDFFGDPDTLSLAGTWYFKPVSTDGVPLAEAAYLGHASSLSVIAARFEIFDTHLNAQALGAEYYLPNTLFYAGAGIARSEVAYSIAPDVIKDYENSWYATLGIAPVDGLLLTTTTRKGGYEPNLTARYVSKLPNGHFYAGGVSVVDPDFGDTSVGFDFDYYLDDSSSLGVGYTDADDEWRIRAEKFFAKNWAFGVSASTADSGDGFGLHVTWRH